MIFTDEGKKLLAFMKSYNFADTLNLLCPGSIETRNRESYFPRCQYSLFFD